MRDGTCQNLKKERSKKERNCNPVLISYFTQNGHDVYQSCIVDFIMPSPAIKVL